MKNLTCILSLLITVTLFSCKEQPEELFDGQYVFGKFETHFCSNYPTGVVSVYDTLQSLESKYVASFLAKSYDNVVDSFEKGDSVYFKISKFSEVLFAHDVSKDPKAFITLNAVDKQNISMFGALDVALFYDHHNCREPLHTKIHKIGLSQGYNELQLNGLNYFPVNIETQLGISNNLYYISENLFNTYVEGTVYYAFFETMTFPNSNSQKVITSIETSHNHAGH